MPTVTPIQGPIFLKNGTVPVVPLFAYPTVSNGTFVQIPVGFIVFIFFINPVFIISNFMDYTYVRISRRLFKNKLLTI